MSAVPVCWLSTCRTFPSLSITAGAHADHSCQEHAGPLLTALLVTAPRAVVTFVRDPLPRARRPRVTAAGTFACCGALASGHHSPGCGP